MHTNTGSQGADMDVEEMGEVLLGVLYVYIFLGPPVLNETVD